MKATDIIHENGKFWVYRLRADHFQVNATGVTHSVCESAYSDESLAIARCDYLANRFPEGFDGQTIWRLGQPQSI